MPSKLRRVKIFQSDKFGVVAPWIIMFSALFIFGTGGYAVWLTFDNNSLTQSLSVGATTIIRQNNTIIQQQKDNHQEAIKNHDLSVQIKSQQSQLDTVGKDLNVFALWLAQTQHAICITVQASCPPIPDILINK